MDRVRQAGATWITQDYRYVRLSAIEKTTRGTARLNAALRIYRDQILPEAQNPERQILYWIDHAKDSIGDEFRCFAIEDDRSVIGYLQYNFFREERILFLEYLCLQGGSQGLAPSAAIDAIRDKLADLYPDGFAVVFEVARKCRGSTWYADTKLIRYFKRLGFRRVDFDYRYPILQSYDGPTSYPADLMINLPVNRHQLLATELRTILRCIYFKHYLRWDRPFLDPPQFRQREALINSLYMAQVEKVAAHDRFDTDGDGRGPTRLNPLRRLPKVGPLLTHVFGPKLLRLAVVFALLLLVARYMGNVWSLIPLTLVVAAVFCLAEDTDASRKLFATIISRLSVGRMKA